MTETTTMTTTSVEEEEAATPLPQPSQQSASISKSSSTPLSMDRDWLKKLILQYARNKNNGVALAVAPMVDQSDYAFRLLARKYGANVTFTPMIHSGLLVGSEAYRTKFLPNYTTENNNSHHHQETAEPCPLDRPCIGQLCGHDPDLLEKAARLLLPHVDALDLNCGCPQGIAKRGFYGAFLLEDTSTLLKCVRRLVQISWKPVSVKVRLLADKEDTSQIDLEASLQLYQQLVDCGIHMLTVHGRTRHQLHIYTGSADWTAIRHVVQKFGSRITILANGNIGSLEDVQACLAATGADGVMSSEAILEYPALFSGLPRMGRIQMAREYLTLAQQYPPEQGHQGSGIKCLKAHVHKFLHPDLETSGHDLRQRVATAQDWQSLWDTVERVERLHLSQNHSPHLESLSWYVRHRHMVCDPDGNPISACQLKSLADRGILKQNNDRHEPQPEDDDPDVLVAASMFDTGCNNIGDGGCGVDGGDY